MTACVAEHICVDGFREGSCQGQLLDHKNRFSVSSGEKMQRGSVVEVLSRTVGGWIPATVTEGEQQGKVTVEFAFDGNVHRKSLATDAPELRSCIEEMDEVSSVISTGLRRSLAVVPMDGGVNLQHATSRALQKLQTRLQELQERNRPPAKSTAATKWAAARCAVEEVQALELWGSPTDSVNGVYRYVPAEGDPQGPPVFQSSENSDKWLYVAKSGSWWVGTSETMGRRIAKGCLCSQPVAAGTLPHEVPAWEVAVNGEWTYHEVARFWLPLSIAVAWQQTTTTLVGVPVVRVTGVVDAFVDGLYDFVANEGDGVGHPPTFQHQQRPNLWLFFATDQRWWIGTEKAKQQKDAVGIVHSATVQPGTHPASATGWHVRNTTVWEECPTLKVQEAPSEARAQAKWAEASRGARDVQVWGTDLCHGKCTIDAKGEWEPPTYRFVEHQDLWLYMAMDGCWWVSSTACKEEGKARGYLRSGVVEPGTLPQDVHRWLEFNKGSWQPREMAQVLLPESADVKWAAAQDAAKMQPVIEISGVQGPRFDGMYDLVDVNEAGHQCAPVYQNQINRLFYLFVAEDGRWWVGEESAMRQRKGSESRMCSDNIRPGTLPFSKGLAWHVYNRTSKEWELQDTITIC